MIQSADSKEKDETLGHLVSKCSKNCAVRYKRRHDKVAAAVHWSIYTKHCLPHFEKWYDYRIETVIENNWVKLLWDFNVKKIE